MNLQSYYIVEDDGKFFKIFPRSEWILWSESFLSLKDIRPRPQTAHNLFPLFYFGFGGEKENVLSAQVY